MDLKKLVQSFIPHAAIAIIATLTLWRLLPRRSRGNPDNVPSDKGEAHDQVASSSSSSSPPPVREDGFQYHVFLSFRGTDTRKNFTDLLYEALREKGITTFIDSESLEKGQKVEELFGYIERSKIFVPIFSSGYADSKWCLQEIAKIVECKRLILPVFLDVEPTDVRHQSGPFELAFRKHLKSKKLEEVDKWSDALAEAGKVSGYTWETTRGYQGKLIQVIVKRILREVNITPLFVAKHPVGLDSRIADVMEILELDALNDVRAVGIHAMGGMGKTTLAKAIYNKISSCFDACSFIANVRETGNQSSGLISLQKQLLHNVFKEENVYISSTSDGIFKIKERIGSKKVLLVLDDVDSESQLDALAGNIDWFCSGSRIIITTRDKKVLKTPWVKQNHVHELNQLDATQSLQLFSWHAFGKEDPITKFAELSEEVASTAAGLPLALEIFGSHFFDLKTEKEWQGMLVKLKQAQDRGLHETLKISYDALDEEEKRIFLDIACFFIGKERELATFMWEGCMFSPDIGIKVLLHKSLVNINDDTGEFEMHDHIRDMGRKIVQTESRELGNRSRLWKADEILDVLENKQGMKAIEAIQHTDSSIPHMVSEEEEFVSLEVESFAPMSQLRMLLLRNMGLKGEFEHIPRNLRWLEWRVRNLDSLPRALCLDNIVVLDLSFSSITQLWNDQESTKTIKVLGKLKVLKLISCENLTVCPDFERMPHLEKLECDGCIRMSELDPSIGHLKNLTHLSLNGCWSLRKVPEEVWRLTSLEELDLSNCSEWAPQLEDSWSFKQPLLSSLKVLNLKNCGNLTICPDFVSMPHVEKLDLGFCGKIKELHSSIGLLKSLTHLNLTFCESLKELPQEIWHLTSLEMLRLNNCTQITTLPSLLREQPTFDKLKVLSLEGCANLTKVCLDFMSMPHLEELPLAGCEKISEIHPSIGALKGLTCLDLSWCGGLKELPQEIWQLTSLEKIDLRYCSQLIALPSQSRDSNLLKPLSLAKLKSLDLSHCKNLTVCPYFTNMLNLEELNFGFSEKISELHPSIGLLKRLTSLNLNNCESLKELPQEIWQLASLKFLDLSCSQIITLPSQSANSTPLKPNLLEKLITLDLHCCNNITVCPDFSSMPHLQELNFDGCEKMGEIHLSIGLLKRLTRLNLSNCGSLKILPQEVWQLTSLEYLDISNCSHITTFPSPFEHSNPSKQLVLDKLEFLNLSGCKNLTTYPDFTSMPHLQDFYFDGCEKIGEINAPIGLLENFTR